MLYALAAALLLLVTAVVAYPLLKPKAPEHDGADQQEAVLEGLRVFSVLRELEYDRAMGKVGDQDYADLRKSYTARAASLLRQQESDRKELNEALEAEIAWVRARMPADAGLALPPDPTASVRPADGEPAVAVRFCTQCGARALAAGQRFCHACGTPRERGAMHHA